MGPPGWSSAKKGSTGQGPGPVREPTSPGAVRLVGGAARQSVAHAFVSVPCAINTSRDQEIAAAQSLLRLVIVHGQRRDNIALYLDRLEVDHFLTVLVSPG